LEVLLKKQPKKTETEREKKETLQRVALKIPGGGGQFGLPEEKKSEED